MKKEVNRIFREFGTNFLPLNTPVETTNGVLVTHIAKKSGGFNFLNKLDIVEISEEDKKKVFEEFIEFYK